MMCKLFLLHILLIGLLNAKESPGFFIKVPKNIPRLGRRSSNSINSFGSIPKINIPSPVSSNL